MTGRYLRFRVVVILLLLTAASLMAAPAQKASPAGKGEVFRLIHADKLYLTKSGEENIMELNGNVHFFYGKTEFFSQRALIFDTQKIARLTGFVTVRNDTLTCTADSVAYYRLPRLMNLGGKVNITERKKNGTFNNFRSMYGTYDKKNDTVTTWNNVTAYSLTEKAKASCGYAFWDRRNGYGYLLQSPQLWSEGDDTLHVSSEKMEYFDADRKIVATFNVMAESGDYHATSDFLLYFLKDDKAVFEGQPRFVSGYADATSRQFNLFFTNRKLNRAELQDSCLIYFADAEGKPKTNWVKANYVNMHINGKNLQDFAAETDVTYFYLQPQEGKKDFFANSATGEKLTATFKEDGKLNRLQMTNRIKGTYRFHNNP